MPKVLPALLAAVLLLAAAPPATPDDPYYYVYGQSVTGNLSVNGTLLEELPGQFEIDGDEIDEFEHGWIALAVDGSRRYSLRFDGTVRSDGAKLYELPFDDDWVWVSMVVDGGAVYCLREDGIVSVGGHTLVDLPMDGFYFRRVAARAGHVYALRSDGAIFKDNLTVPVFLLRGGPGAESGFPDGFAADTVWVALAFHPALDDLYAIRSDGKIRRARVSGLGDGDADLPGDPVTALPFSYDEDADDDGDIDPYPLLDDVYVDIEFLADGTWLAMAGDGRVYSATSGVVPVFDFPGTAIELDDSFTDLATFGQAFWAVRADGYAFRGDADVPRVTLPGLPQGRIAISTTPPNLGDIDDHPPKCLLYLTKTVVGNPIDIPVMATDIEMRSSDLVIAATKLPVDSTGSAGTYDAQARMFRWHSPQVAGTYKFKFTVSDASSSVEFLFTLEVKNPDTDPKTATGPLLPEITAGKPIVGQPFSFTVVTGDKDGDPVQVTVKLDTFPFDVGATFDPVTRRFDWTPRPEDQGDRTVKFQCFDGTTQKTLSVLLKVKNGLIF